MTKAAVLLNGHAGTNAASEDRETENRVRDAFHDTGLEAEVETVSGERLQDAARAAAGRGVDIVVAGGGDGTVSAVAGALAGTDVPLGVLPLGTLNHFAKDMGIPQDLVDAIAVLAEGRVAIVDVGCVNDRVFLNNSSVGAYAHAVRDRDRQRDELGRRKWPAMAIALVKTLRRHPLLAVRLLADDESLVTKTPLVFVGNNQYQLDLLHVGQRCCLNQGELSLYVATTQTRWGMVKLAVRALLGQLDQARDFRSRCVQEVRIETLRKGLHVAVDGEIVLMRPPLEYRIWPQALKVMAPLAAEERVEMAGAAVKPR